LINGAAGRVGAYAVQIAAALGAEVTGVIAPAKISTTPATGRCAGQ
jgi:NADPH:quinone reductase-like Zn-dependent oxidoreductase